MNSRLQVESITTEAGTVRCQLCDQGEPITTVAMSAGSPMDWHHYGTADKIVCVLALVQYCASTCAELDDWCKTAQPSERKEFRTRLENR